MPFSHAADYSDSGFLSATDLVVRLTFMEKCRSPLPVLGSCLRRFAGVDREESKLEAAAAAIVNILKSLKSPPLKDDSDLILRIDALGLDAELVPDPELRIVFIIYWINFQ